MSRVSVVPALEQDLERLGHVQRRAFATSSIDRLIFGRCTPEDLARANAQRLLKCMRDPLSSVMKAVRDSPGATDDDVGGEIIGLGLWGRPHEFDQVKHDEEQREKENETPEARIKRLQERFPPGADYELADGYFGRMDLGIKEPHWRELQTRPRSRKPMKHVVSPLCLAPTLKLTELNSAQTCPS